MATQNYVRLIKDYYDAFNRREFEIALNMVADNAELELIPFEKKLQGKSEIRSSFERWMAAFPDMRLDVTEVIVSEQSGVAELVGRGTQKGTVNTPSGEIESTGKRVELKGCDVFKFRNGKIISIHSFYDSGSIMRQLGLTTQKEAA
jgi:steroid delta-isomerase-like uncharacterized protein